MSVKIFTIELSDSPHNKKSLLQKQELITEFEALVNDFIDSHVHTTIVWLQSSSGTDYGGSFTQLTTVITY